MTEQASGLWVPAMTPFKDDHSLDRERYIAFCHEVMGEGADGLAIFGTTSEANSLTLTERMDTTEALVESGIPAAKLMPGAGCCAHGDTLALTKHALGLGCHGVLALPPFYYKGVSDEGVYAAFARLIDDCADDDLKLYLYHFPAMSAVPITHAVIERLLKNYGSVIAGLKDSSLDYDFCLSLRKAFPEMAIFPASEALLTEGFEAGMAGTITGTGNIQPGRIATLLKALRSGSNEASALQEHATIVRQAFAGTVLIPALKAVKAKLTAEQCWSNVRPPLVRCDDATAEKIVGVIGGL